MTALNKLDISTGATSSYKLSSQRKLFGDNESCDCTTHK
jgi:hypothetical protein